MIPALVLAVMTVLTPTQERELERIATLGYISGREPVPERTGVILHAPESAFQGYTLYTPAEGPEAYLIDMEGEVVHRWSTPGALIWSRAHLFPNGDVVVITRKPARLYRLNRDSELVMRYRKPAHHDFDVRPSGAIYVLVRNAVMLPEIRDGAPTLDDAVALIDPMGHEYRRVSIVDAFMHSERYAAWFEELELPEGADIFHTNSIEVFERDGRTQALLSLRSISTLAILDIASREIVWALTGPWRMQHEAQFVGDNVLLFDNLGLGEQSRVIEIDPDTAEIVWSYTEEGFFSKGAGAQQRLPNGNTLIVESENGRIIEIDPSSEIVWEYVNPETVDDAGETILGILRAERLPADFPLDWLEGAAGVRKPSRGS